MLRNSLILLSESGTARALATRTPLRVLSRRFVPGEDVDDFLEAAAAANASGLLVTGNYLGEAEKSEATAREAVRVYRTMLGGIRERGIEGNISVKPTQIGLAIDGGTFRENLREILDDARSDGSFVRLDMESFDYVQKTLDPFEELWTEGYRNVGVVLQAYLYRTMDDARRMAELGVRVRLCKGAYAEPPEVAFQKKADVDRNFVDVAKLLLTDGHYPALATHDDRIIEELLAFAASQGITADRFEFQMLYGVRRDLQQDLVARRYRVRVYIPFGVSWYPYLMRRLAERPANLFFFVGSVLKESPLGRFRPSRGEATRAARTQEESDR